MIHTIIACATLLNLSLPTKLEMSNILPKAAEYCLAHPEGKLSVVYGPFPEHRKSGIMYQGEPEKDA